MRDEQRPVGGAADEIAPRWCERDRINRHGMPDHPNQAAAPELVDLHRVAARDRSAVSGGGHGGEGGREVSDDRRHAGQSYPSNRARYSRFNEAVLMAA